MATPSTVVAPECGVITQWKSYNWMKMKGSFLQRKSHNHLPFLLRILPLIVSSTRQRTLQTNCTKILGKNNTPNAM